MVGVLPDAVRIYRRGSISEGLHPTLMVAALEAAKVGNARPWSSYERYETSPPTINCITAYSNSLCALQRCKNVRVTSPGSTKCIPERRTEGFW